MQSVSSIFLDALRGSHTVVAQADVWYDGEMVAEDVDIAGGSITVDTTSFIRRSGTCNITDKTGILLPKSFTSPLSPFGQEINIRRGILLPDGTKEMVSLGWFRIDNSKGRQTWRWSPLRNEWISLSADVPLSLSDRFANLVDSDFTAPSTPAASQTCVNEIRRITTGLVPFGETIDADLTTTVPTDLVYEGAKSDAVQRLAATINARVYADPDGFTRVQGAWSTTPVWTVDAGENGVLISADWGADRKDLVNAIIARGEGSSDKSPVQAVAFQNTGPLRWGGPFGQVSRVISSPYWYTQAMVDAAAKSELSRANAQLEQLIEVHCVPNPALEGNDYITVDHPNGVLSGRIVSYTLPIGASGGEMAITMAVTNDALWSLMA